MELRYGFDEAEINVGDSLITKISKAIQEMDFVAAVISKNSIGSEWVNKELSLAMNKEINGRKVVILPILIDDCPVPSFIADKAYADFRLPQNYDDAYFHLFKAINKHKAESNQKEPVNKKDRNIEDFIDINIIGVDKQKTQPSSDSPFLFNVHFELTNNPPKKWTEIFNGERNFPRHSMWRRAYISGKYVIVDCPLEELEKYHIKDIKEDIQNTNTKYRGVIFQEQQSKLRIEEEIKKQKEMKNNILDGLKI